MGELREGAPTPPAPPGESNESGELAVGVPNGWPVGDLLNGGERGGFDR